MHTFMFNKWACMVAPLPLTAVQLDRLPCRIILLRVAEIWQNRPTLDIQYDTVFTCVTYTMRSYCLAMALSSYSNSVAELIFHMFG